MLKQLKIGGLLLAWVAMQPAHAVETRLAQDIVAAGTVRMQAQRLAKLYRQQTMGLPGEVARRLEQAVVAVDAEFGRLGQGAALPLEARQTLVRNQRLWHELRPVLRQHGQQAEVDRLGDALMLAAGRLGLQIESAAETPQGRLVDQASRLNMLSQRLARLYLQAAGGDLAQGLRVDISQARREFASGLSELDRAPENTPATREALALVKTQWLFFDQALQRLDGPARGGRSPVHDVASSSERIAEVLTETTGHYVQAYQDQARGPSVRR